MIVIRVSVKVKPEEKENFVAHMQQEIVAVKRQFEGCERFGLFADLADEYTFLLYEEWQNQTVFEAYKNSDYFKQNGALLFPMMAGEPDSAYFASELIQ